jgi:small-conductance mechanosensitive channel
MPEKRQRKLRKRLKKLRKRLKKLRKRRRQTRSNLPHVVLLKKEIDEKAAAFSGSFPCF